MKLATAKSTLGPCGTHFLSLTTALTAAGNSIDLGAGNDTLTLANAGPNRINFATVESILGSPGADTHMLTTALTGAGNSIDLGAGNETLTLANPSRNTIHHA